MAWWGNSSQKSFWIPVLPMAWECIGNMKSKERLPAHSVAQAALRNSLFLRTPWEWTEFKEDDFFFLVVLQELEPFKTTWHHLWPRELWIKPEALSVQNTKVRFRGCLENDVKARIWCQSLILPARRQVTSSRWKIMVLSHWWEEKRLFTDTLRRYHQVSPSTSRVRFPQHPFLYSTFVPNIVSGLPSKG